MNSKLDELAYLYVLDRLGPGEREKFEARLMDNPPLASLVRELEDALARSVHALPQVEPPGTLLAEIETRIGKRPSLDVQKKARPIGNSWAWRAKWGVAALIAVSLATIAVQELRRSNVRGERAFVVIASLSSSESMLTQVPLRGRDEDTDSRFIQLASLAERYWEKPQNLPVKQLTGSLDRRGYALFDPESRQGFIGIQQLPALSADKRYHLWVLDTVSGIAQEAGIIPLTGSHSGLYYFAVDPAKGTEPGRLDFLVTAEEASEPKTSRPNGKIVLGHSRIF